MQMVGYDHLFLAASERRLFRHRSFDDDRVVSIALIMGVGHMRRQTNFIPNLAVGSGLVLFTAYRFFGRTLQC
jgi:hypothetical protein